MRKLLFIIIIGIFASGCGDSEERIQDLEDHKELSQLVNDGNERIERIDFRADGNSQRSDSTRKMLNTFLVGDQDFSLDSDNNIDFYDRLKGEGEYQNINYSYFAKIDSIDTQFKIVKDDIEDLSERLEETREELKSDIDDLDDEISSLNRKLKKIERAVVRLENDLKENSLIFMDQRWKNLDIDLLYKEFQITE